MNERIRELVAQADEWTDNQDIFSSEWRDCMLQKFAELIVRECIGIVETVEPGYGDYRDQIEDAFRGVCKEEIKEYFGVRG